MINYLIGGYIGGFLVLVVLLHLVKAIFEVADPDLVLFCFLPEFCMRHSALRIFVLLVYPAAMIYTLINSCIYTFLGYYHFCKDIRL